MSVNQGIMTKEAVEQRVFIMAPVTWQSQLLYLPSCSSSLVSNRWKPLLPIPAKWENASSNDISAQTIKKYSEIIFRNE